MIRVNKKKKKKDDLKINLKNDLKIEKDDLFDDCRYNKEREFVTLRKS